jgi:ATP-dependent helicase/nuclease subunit B
MLGPNLLKTHREERAVELARRIDRATPVEPSARPRPRPSAEQRRVDISATALDRLRGDPFAFYANSILGLSRLDPLDAEPSPAWLGTMTHGVLEQWHKDGDPPGELEARATAAVDRLGVHPFMRATWLPRLQRGLAWVEKATARMAGDRRRPVAIECPGSMKAGGVTINGKADRIDQLSDGTLAIIDYKTGKPPSNKRVEQGFSLQLGVLGLIADAGGFEGVRGKPERFEYWSLARNDKSDTGFGALIEPIPENGKRSGIPRAEFLSETRRYLDDAIARWIAGDEPFVARLNPDLPNFGDYDQLMRLDEWQARGDDGGQGSNS